MSFKLLNLIPFPPFDINIKILSQGIDHYKIFSASDSDLVSIYNNGFAEK